MGVVPRTWMCADVRRYAGMHALSGTRIALVPILAGSGPTGYRSSSRLAGDIDRHQSRW